MSSKTAIIIRREYMERVTKKSFIITTILMPILMLALMVTPVLVAELAGTDQRSMTVIDNSGMIAPQLATMLCVITTDAVVTAGQLQAALNAGVEMSFNRIDVDGCMSTNDTVLLLASGASGIEPDPDEF